MITRKSTRYHSNASIRSNWPKKHSNKTELMKDISVEGISFISDTCYTPGMIFSIWIPLVVPNFGVLAEVEWCQPHDKNYEVGAKFLQIKEGFRIKTVEQLNFIEEYRKKVYFNEGRSISPEEANAELIQYYRQSIGKQLPDGI